MAGNLNRVFLMGNLTRDIELRHVSGNQAVANIGLAVNRRWKSPEGENRDETTFVDCEAWGRTAEVMAQYLAKGRPVFIEGRLKLDQWEKEGQKFSKLRVVVESFQFIDSRGGGEGGGGGGGGGRSSSSQGGSRQGSSSSSAAAPANVADDDIPF
ncbi:MAG: single-stranded DNA-binding protein [Phycisphaerae bacterium]|nr:single-stranded DNA-binding protein [Phycisphaerae bacterium]